ncbi:hypothetical protein A3H16_00295 [Candidatus Kaiserbacteria bacterium RIFCSPLOWO2_12_FULL_53_8]|uniref:Phosphatidic acid phosphatase type 2/haloperoxidase domain-containing protein n=2 Tax=Candidatus Kaiseribacteriota TaxID=1752734 RepID=A0A1F6CU80_9BACT|nr:MAG: hypothetical protein A2851_03950 [Candidatus Kaiserbacteria bacterium RIFCSPHIGHO2_01_FULL_53_29]OGG91856.1 MAG: hypothetical protein A3H16_00295 [Candidatus Kaiserbacteria bacterium RIFCSPLOWO2_12_FULL_53_8]
MISLIASFDMRILDMLYAHRDLQTTNIFIGISELGSTLVVCGLMVCLGLAFALRRKLSWAAGLVISVIGAGGTTLVLKELVQRARPDVFYRAYAETGFSFPSAHAALAAAFYGFCIYLLWKNVPPRLWRILATIVLATLIAAIAFSRLYLGVHYVSDVIGGLIVGGIFVWIGIVVVRRLEKRL